MDQDLDKIEEELKEDQEKKEQKEHKVSGRSVFTLKKIIKEKSSKEDTSSNKNS